MAKEKKKLKNIILRRYINLAFFFALSVILSIIFFLVIFKPCLSNIFISKYKSDNINSENVLIKKTSLNYQAKISFDSFYDNFYNLSSVEKYSNLYYDTTFSAFMSPLNYNFIKYEGDINLVDNNINYEKVCIEDNCLESIEKKLYINGNSIYLPSFNGDLEFISIDNIEDIFYVSFVIFFEENYEVKFYTYDNYLEEVLKDLNIKSDEPGVLGVGGTKDDFLVFYGSSLGQLYRVYNQEILDCSNILSRRTSFDYFKPEIFRVINNSGKADFYVYNSLENNPILIKFWDNIGDSNYLSGAMDLYKLFNISSSEVKITRVNKDINNFNELILDYGNNNYYRFLDFGFSYTNRGEIISTQIPNLNSIFSFNVSEVKKIELEFDKDSLGQINDGAYNLYLKEIKDSVSDKRLDSDLVYSNDLNNEDWTKIDLKDYTNIFSEDRIESFRLKIVFPKYENSFSSPFLNSWIFNYYYYK